jgi:GAF domain-containing protein/HAMP domain-containing protein
MPIPLETYQRVLSSGTPEIQYADVEGREFAVMLAPLVAYGGRTIGILEIIRSREQALAEIRSDIINGLLVAALIGIVGLAVIWLVVQRQVRQPIAELSATARRQLEGDLTARAPLNHQDEFDDLAETLNGLSENLARTIQQLESRVTERTKELAHANDASARRARQFEAISQVTSSIASVQSLDELLPRITQLISDEFNYYHVGIFLLDDSNQYAILSAANSAGGQRMLSRGHRLQVGVQGIVGYVIGTGNPRVALDTGADAVFFDNPDLPDTRSELALPLIIAGRVVGALDVQSIEPNAFSPDDVDVLSTLANQVSIAIQNARSFVETRRLLAEAQGTMAGYINESWNILKPPSLGTGYQKVGTSIKPLEQPLADAHIHEALEQGRTAMASGRLAVPIRLRGRIIGILNLQIPEDQKWAASEIRVAEAVAERLSLAIETATLIKATQRRANIERITTDITGRIGSSTSLETILQTAAQELSRALGGSDVLVQIEPVAMKLSSSGQFGA